MIAIKYRDYLLIKDRIKNNKITINGVEYKIVVIKEVE